MKENGLGAAYQDTFSKGKYDLMTPHLLFSSCSAQWRAIN
jgi:hypothetical protein